MESASFLKPSIPWGPKTQLHSQAVYGQACNWLSAPTSQWPHPTLRKQEPKGLDKLLAGSAQNVGGNTTWLNPVDTRCSCMPVHASRVSLLFSWACVLCGETRDSTEPSGPSTEWPGTGMSCAYRRGAKGHMCHRKSPASTSEGIAAPRDHQAQVHPPPFESAGVLRPNAAALSQLRGSSFKSCMDLGNAHPLNSFRCPCHPLPGAAWRIS